MVVDFAEDEVCGGGGLGAGEGGLGEGGPGVLGEGAGFEGGGAGEEGWGGGVVEEGGGEGVGVPPVWARRRTVQRKSLLAAD